jgi:hypothetical protein
MPSTPTDDLSICQERGSADGNRSVTVDNDTGEAPPAGGTSGEQYREATRRLLGPEMFEECCQVAREAPEPTPHQIAVTGRMFGPGMRRLAERTAA